MPNNINTGIIDLKLDSNNWSYILIENQDLATVSDLDAIEQHLKQRLQFFRGEYTFDLTRGIPFHDEFFKKNPNPIVMDTILKDVILTTPGVIEMLSFIIEINANRILNINFKVYTSYGELDYSGEIPLGNSNI
jgi:hypothetical protein